MSTESMQPPYLIQDEELRKELIRLVESRMSAQLTCALAADQRALIFAGFLAAAIVALIGGAATAFTSQNDAFLGTVATSVAAVLLVAMAMATYAARPVAFEFVGTEPSKWVDDIKLRRTAAEALADQLLFYDGMMARNHACMVRGAEWLKRSLYLTFGALGAGGIVLIANFADKYWGAISLPQAFVMVMSVVACTFFAAGLARD